MMISLCSIISMPIQVLPSFCFFTGSKARFAPTMYRDCWRKRGDADGMRRCSFSDPAEESSTMPAAHIIQAKRRTWLLCSIISLHRFQTLHWR